MSKHITSQQTPTHDEISARAHRIYETQGRPDGKSMEHWLQAEAQLNAERKAQANRAAAKPAPAASTPAANPPATGGSNNRNWQNDQRQPAGRN
jgi:hypothetical protein